ncbi:unnamed protein product [Cylicostephanus goldi]|uniref:Uncharacterized protein n=1 Tax=Cylicostephanus goldi TaxID=71465 RepID=A0A3P7QTJ0_CYLGO|nr:unnamed protein product [Cylicostephanus goldi]
MLSHLVWDLRTIRDANGIPYYPVNEERSVGNGHTGRVDFGSWGGGYSGNLGARDFWSQTVEGARIGMRVGNLQPVN